MKFDLSRFKKMKSDAQSTTLQHPDGHEITIAHKALSPKMKEQLSALPASTPVAMKDGGETLDKADDDKWEPAKKEVEVAPSASDAISALPSFIDAPQAAAPATIADGAVSPQDLQAASNDVAAKLGPQGAQAVDQAAGQANQTVSLLPPGSPESANAAPAATSGTSATPPPASSQAPSPAATTGGASSPTPSVEGGYNTQMAGINAEAKAKGDLGNAQAGILQAQAPIQRQALQVAQDNFKAANDEYNAFIQDYKNGHVDPNHYMANRTTGQKIATAIGLILGGIGGGLTGQENPALKFVNAQIDRDIDAQKAELGKKENLLSANLRHFGNLKDAAEATAAMQKGIAATQLEAAAAKAQSPLAKAQALKAAGELQSQNVMAFQNMAMRKTLEQAQQAGNNMDPASFVPYLPNATPDEQKTILKEIQNRQDTLKMKDQFMAEFDKAAKENTLSAVRTPVSLLNMRAMMLPIIHDKEGRVNEFEQKTTSDLEPSKIDNAARVAAKRKGYEAFLNQKMSAPTAKAHGLDLDKFQSTSGDPFQHLPPQQKAYAQWAKANPNDPKAALVLKKLGLQ